MSHVKKFTKGIRENKETYSLEGGTYDLQRKGQDEKFSGVRLR